MNSTSPAAASPLAPHWLTAPADVNALVPKLWAHDVVRVDGELTVAGVPASALAKEFGTPLYVLSEADFRQQAREFKLVFDSAFAALCGGVDVYYAGKSFLCVEAARWAVQEGLRVDTCTGGELAVAQRAGIAGEALSLHGNNKSDAELTRALHMGVGRIVVDSLDELRRIAALAQTEQTTAKIMLRLTPGVHASTHDYIATAHEDQKFGLSMTADDGARSAAAQAVAAALASEAIELLGIHCHIGSQIFEPEGFNLAAERMLAFLARIKAEHGVELPELDLGGGYGIAYTEEDHPRPPSEIAEAMAAVVRDSCARHELAVPRVSIEPGRAIVGTAGFTLYEAGTIKTVQVDAGEEGNSYPRRYISVDGGMSDNPRPLLYDADFSATLASRGSQSPPVLSRVVGKHCESGDIVVRDVYLPADVQARDLLAVPATGAYCWALASNYNYVPRPPVVAVKDGAARLIIRGETEDDLLARDVMAQTGN